MVKVGENKNTRKEQNKGKIYKYCCNRGNMQYALLASEDSGLAKGIES